jgi:hypothetical protein
MTHLFRTAYDPLEPCPSSSEIPDSPLEMNFG